MKSLKLFLAIPLLASLVIISSCDPSDISCQIKRFYWEDQYYDAYYSPTGRLELLKSSLSEVRFYYDEYDKLYHAEIHNDGEPSPTYEFDFIHGPFGITEVDLYPLVGTHVKEIFHYSSPTQVDYSITQEFGGSDPTEVTFEIFHYFTYSGGNVKHVDSPSSVIHTSYSAHKYDKHGNPFRMLAKAVGNPVFFPVCRTVFFPVSLYDIPYVSLLSKNNPLSGQYEILGSGLDPQIQEFHYTYTGPLVNTIEWTDTSYGTTVDRKSVV